MGWSPTLHVLTSGINIIFETFFAITCSYVIASGCLFWDIVLLLFNKTHLHLKKQLFTTSMFYLPIGPRYVCCHPHSPAQKEYRKGFQQLTSQLPSHRVCRRNWGHHPKQGSSNGIGGIGENCLVMLWFLSYPKCLAVLARENNQKGSMRLSVKHGWLWCQKRPDMISV